MKFLDVLMESIVKRSDRLPEAVRAEFTTVAKRFNTVDIDAINTELTQEKADELRTIIAQMSNSELETMAEHSQPFKKEELVSQARETLQNYFSRTNARQNSIANPRQYFWNTGTYWYDRTFRTSKDTSDHGFIDSIGTHLKQLSIEDPTKFDIEFSMTATSPMKDHLRASARWIQQGAPVVQHQLSDKSGSKRERESNEPQVRIYRIGHPIQVDCRPAIHAYIIGERRVSPTVQFLVRGHWRNQSCGPKHLERRITWIQPFWKGPEDAPINLRPHVLQTVTGSIASNAIENEKTSE